MNNVSRTYSEIVKYLLSGLSKLESVVEINFDEEMSEILVKKEDVKCLITVYKDLDEAIDMFIFHIDGGTDEELDVWFYSLDELDDLIDDVDIIIYEDFIDDPEDD